MKKAVVLLSGGLDSATTLYLAKKKGFRCFCLIFDYGQRHKKEIEAAKRIAYTANCPYQILRIKLPWGGSSLLAGEKRLRITDYDFRTDIPATYVPARNSIFLSFALSYAEAAGIETIFIGATARDFSGYPDCRPQFFQAFNKVIAVGTKKGRAIKIETPLIHKAKAEIIRLGHSLGVPYDLTWSCYRGGKQPCGRCDTCYYRAKGFQEVGLIDPLSK